MSGTNGSVAIARPDNEYELLCDDVQQFLRRFTTEDGVPVTTDTELDGTTAYVPTGVVHRCEETSTVNPALGSTIQRQTGAGAVTIPAGARSVTVNIYAGAPTLSIGGATAVAIPAGSSLTWSVDQGSDNGETLEDAFVFTGAVGHDFIVSSTREV
ncbi:hypothetical protein [Streptomyces arboris]|uniref:hypothetical protein n=1 Tax=Streptomyces arboris TaxID=2600619 RepID=UPI003BF467C1